MKQIKNIDNHCTPNCTIKEDGDWHGLMFACLQEFLLNQSDKLTVIDLGANKGEFAIEIGKELKIQKVYAVEPSTYNIQLLIHNVKASNLQNIDVIQCAVSDKNGKINLFSGNSTPETYNIIQGRENWQQSVLEVVDMATLDFISSKLNTSFDIIKIDVEGAEALVLEGGISTINKSKIVLIEIHTKETFAKVLSIAKTNNWTVMCQKHKHIISLDSPSIDFCYQLIIVPKENWFKS